MVSQLRSESVLCRIRGAALPFLFGEAEDGAATLSAWALQRQTSLAKKEAALETLM